MSHLHDGDDDLHYEDGSHRWAGGGEAWQARVRAHVEAHAAAEKAAGASWWPGKLWPGRLRWKRQDRPN